MPKHNPKTNPKPGDRLVKIVTYSNGVSCVLSRTVLAIEHCAICNGTGKETVRPITGKMPYFQRCPLRCNQHNYAERTKVIWTRKRPTRPCSCALTAWRKWAATAW